MVQINETSLDELNRVYIVFGKKDAHALNSPR